MPIHRYCVTIFIINYLAHVIRASDGGKPNIFGRIGTCLFCAPFLLGGILVFTQLFLSPLSRSLRSASWETTRATVLKAELKRDGDSAKIVIRYQYFYDEVEHEGNRYHFDDSSTNIGVERMEKVVARHTVGSQIIIHVNPDQPSESVVNREISFTSWIGLPFSMPFLLVGICGVGYALLAGIIYRKKEALRLDAAKLAKKAGALEIAEYLEQPHRWKGKDEKLHSLKGQASIDGLSLLALSIFWNGIVSVFVIVMIVLFISGSGMAWFLFLFLIPFEIVGGSLLWATYRQLTNKTPPDYIVLTTLERYSNIITVNWVSLAKGFSKSRMQSMGWKLTLDDDKDKNFNSWLRQFRGNHDSSDGFITYEQGSDKIHCGSIEVKGNDLLTHGLKLIVAWKERSHSPSVMNLTLIPSDND